MWLSKNQSDKQVGGRDVCVRMCIVDNETIKPSGQTEQSGLHFTSSRIRATSRIVSDTTNTLNLHIFINQNHQSPDNSRTLAAEMEKAPAKKRPRQKAMREKTRVRNSGFASGRLHTRNHQRITTGYNLNRNRHQASGPDSS